MKEMDKGKKKTNKNNIIFSSVFKTDFQFSTHNIFIL